MTALQTLEIRAADIRARLSAIAGESELNDETRAELERLKLEYTDNESRQTALKIAGDKPPEPVETRTEDTKDSLKELRSNVDFGRYVGAALTGHAIANGPELEFNKELGIVDGFFPLELLGGPLEQRAARDGDASTAQMTWLDRVFQGTAAERVGISFRPVSPGVAAYPVTTAGGTPAQRGRTEAAAESTYTVNVTEIKPARRAVHGIYSIEDDMRLPGLSDAIERDMRMAMVESVDITVFKGDSGANENIADITGLQGAGITEATLSQTNKVKGDELVKFFLAYVDGQYAASLGDVRIVRLGRL